MLAGGLAGVIAWLPIYPLDVLKTRVQAATAADSRGKTLAHYAREVGDVGCRTVQGRCLAGHVALRGIYLSW